MVMAAPCVLISLNLFEDTNPGYSSAGGALTLSRRLSCYCSTHNVLMPNYPPYDIGLGLALCSIARLEYRCEEIEAQLQQIDAALSSRSGP